MISFPRFTVMRNLEIFCAECARVIADTGEHMEAHSWRDLLAGKMAKVFCDDGSEMIQVRPLDMGTGTTTGDAA